MTTLLRLALAATLLTLAGCASGPRYDIAGVDSALTPAAVAAAPGAPPVQRVVWGGLIITTRNQSDYTEIEVLSYPLDSAQRPDTGSPAQGRFLVRHSGYLEGIDYAPGRSVTVSGSLERRLQGKVGDAPYTFPLVAADHLYLWPRERAAPSSPQFHFGVGVIFGH